MVSFGNAYSIIQLMMNDDAGHPGITLCTCGFGIPHACLWFHQGSHFDGQSATQGWQDRIDFRLDIENKSHQGTVFWLVE